MSDSAKPETIDIEKESKAIQLEDLKKTITVDTLHNDEALKVLANYQGEETWTAEEEKKLTRKIDRRLLSILCITYGLQYYDKAMLSQAVIRTSEYQSLSNAEIYSGAVRIKNGPGPQRWTTILDVRRHLLPRIHLRRVSCNCPRSKVPD
jgi:hypothetical protein